MGLRIFSVVGEALNFGGRRMETIARVAWLPIVLSMILNMTAVFAYLSVIVGRLITFSDVPQFFLAQQEFVRLASRGFENSPAQMWAITAITIFLNWILVSSYMAPLIRYAGLGEKPSPGTVKLAFGPDQLRFIFSSILSFLLVVTLVFGPILSATYYVGKYIADALSKTVATFPNPDSLHTIELSTVGQQIQAEGTSWIYDLAIPAAAAIPLAVLMWLVVFFHFHPRNRPNANVGNYFLRGLTTIAFTIFLLGAGYFLLAELILQQFSSNIIFVLATADFVEQLEKLNEAVAFDLTGLKEVTAFILQTPASRVIIFAAISFYLVNYFSLRLFPYPGVAVCRKSFGLGNTFVVSRGWDFIRLGIIVYGISLFLFYAYAYVINFLFFQKILLPSMMYIQSAMAITTRMNNAGVTSDWVYPATVWAWNLTRIAVNLIWTFFTVGVAAGLYGRLYRESVK